jgi:hypothetical protein
MTDWQPGDPLFPRRGHIRSMISLIPDQAEEGGCRCNDAARWPNPFTDHAMKIKNIRDTKGNIILE